MAYGYPEGGAPKPGWRLPAPMLAIHCALRGWTGSAEMSRFQILFAGNIGHPANCGPAGGGGGGGGAGVAVGAGREAVGWGLAVGVALMVGDAEALAEGDWRAGDAMAMRSLDRP